MVVMSEMMIEAIQKEETKMKTTTYIRKPFELEAVQVTDENIEEVAKWCDGQVVVNNFSRGEGMVTHKYIKVRVHHPLTERQTRAFIGDWVLYAGKGYKVYTDKAFQRNFVLPTPESQKLIENVPNAYDPEIVVEHSTADKMI